VKHPNEQAKWVSSKGHPSIKKKKVCEVTKSTAVNLFYVYGRTSVAIAKSSLVTNILAAYYFLILQESM
jgi:hypothetical protein